MGFLNFGMALIFITTAVVLDVHNVSTIKALMVGCGIGAVLCGIYWTIRNKSVFE